MQNHIDMILVTGVLMLLSGSCSKSVHPAVNAGPGDTTEMVTPPNDPAFAATIGFFGNDFSAKTFSAPASTVSAKPSLAPDAVVTVDMSQVSTKISKYLFGNNTNMWTGQMTTQAPLIGYLKDLSPNVLRGPGGSASDVYFWNAPFRTLPADVKATLYDGTGNPVHTDSTNYWFGMQTPAWSLSIDDYYQALQMTQTSSGLITVNYAYARYGTGATPVATAAHLAADWVRYDNGKTKFWEVGNECYGNWEACYKIDVTKNQDGQPAIVSGDLYGRHFRVFSDSMKAAAKEIGKTIYIGAVIMDAAPQSWQDTTSKNWNKGVFSEAGVTADYFIVHDYFTAYNANSTVTDIFNSAAVVPAGVMTYVKSQFAQYGIGDKPVAMTEWNIQAVGSKQNTSNVAGLHAVLTMGALIKNNYGQASRWDLANGYANGDDQGLFNIGDETGVPKWNPRPVFYYMYYLQKCLGDRLVGTSVSLDTNVVSFASSFSSGESGVVVVNKSNASKTVQVRISNFIPGKNYYWYTLAGGSSGDFDGTVSVNGIPSTNATGGPLNYNTIKANSAGQQGGIAVTVPGRAAVFIVAEHG